MKKFLLIVALLAGCSEKPAPKTVCRSFIDSNCEDDCVMRTSLTVNMCQKVCKREVCP